MISSLIRIASTTTQRVWLAALGCVLFLCLNAGHAHAAVTVAAFNVQWQGAQVKVTWTTGNEVNNAGFNVHRSAAANGPYTKLNTSLIPSQCIGCVGGASYTYNDSSASAGQNYFYKLEAVEYGGGTQFYGPVSTALNTPTATPTSQGAPTTTTVPKFTSTPTVTALPSNTPTHTPTPVPSATLTATPLPTATPTPSPPRPTATRTATPLATQPASAAAPSATAEPTSVVLLDPTAAATQTVAPPSATPTQLALVPAQVRTPSSASRPQSGAPQPNTDDQTPVAVFIVGLLFVGGIGAALLVLLAGFLIWRTRHTYS